MPCRASPPSQPAAAGRPGISRFHMSGRDGADGEGTDDGTLADIDSSMPVCVHVRTYICDACNDDEHGQYDDNEAY